MKKLLKWIGIIFVVLIVIGIFAGKSGDNSSAPKSDSKQTTASAPKKDAAHELYDKFLQLPMEGSYDDVKGVMGSDGKLSHESQIGDIKTQLYSWNVGPSNIQATFSNGALTSKAMAGVNMGKPDGASDITMEQFNQIQSGMSYDDVKNITGRDGALISQASLMGQESSMYLWSNGVSGNMTISFAGGAVNSKTQIGLK